MTDALGIALELAQWALLVLVVFRLFKMEQHLIQVAAGDPIVMRLPAFKGWSTTSMREVSERDLLGRPGAMVFLAGDDEASRRGIPLGGSCAEMGSEQVTFVVVADRSRATDLGKEFLTGLKSYSSTTFDIVADPIGAIAAEFSVPKFPTIVQFDADGRVTRTGVPSAG